jgi:hypothetical protein
MLVFGMVQKLWSLCSVGSLLVLCAAVQLGSQSSNESQINTPAAAELPSFDVASIKPVSVPYGGSVQFSAGRVHGRAVTVKQLLKAAYNVTASQILGAPNWVDGDRFDFDARTSADVDGGHIRLMIRRMLMERCQLAVRSERRESSLYGMTVPHW